MKVFNEELFKKPSLLLRFKMLFHKKKIITDSSFDPASGEDYSSLMECEIIGDKIIITGFKYNKEVNQCN